MIFDVSREEVVLLLGLTFDALGFPGLTPWLDGIQFREGQITFSVKIHGLTAEIVADVRAKDGLIEVDLAHILVGGVDTIQIDRKIAADQIISHLAPYSKWVRCWKDAQTANLMFEILPGLVSVAQLWILDGRMNGELLATI